MTSELQPIKARLRAERQAAGLSLSQMAARTGYSKGYLGNIETGEKPVILEHVEAYDRALSTGGLLADLWRAMEDGAEMLRRSVIRALSTVALVPITQHEARLLVAENVRRSLLDSLGVDDWPQLAEEYGRRFMTDPPAILRSNLIGHLRILAESVNRDGLNAQMATARLMTVHGMAVANIGDVRSSARWYRSARDVADLTKDAKLQRWVRARAAFRRGYEGAEPGEVLAECLGVDDVEAHLASAQAYARLGERSRALDALNAARKAYARVDQTEGTIYAMPPWRMAMSSAHVYAQLGEVALHDAEMGGEPPSTMVRWDAQQRLQQAVALTRSGDVAAGRALARAVMDGSAPEHRSIVLGQMFREAGGLPEHVRPTG